MTADSLYPLPTETATRLRDEAEELVALVGEPPDNAAGFTPELAFWYDRYYMAARALAISAGADARALRAAMGPTWTSFDPVPSWRALLAVAAIGVERGGAER
ncbi:MAG: hypothetical protein M3P85_11160 [Actinomycetota bacterium]|nr:hypothetical protein [Actinomycetota bacterium]